MKKFSLIIVMSICPVLLFSQLVNEKFDDAEIFNNPTWYGHTDSVKIFTSTTSSSYPKAILPSLRMYATGSADDSIYISTPNQRSFSTEPTEWSFWARVPSATSGNNSKIYLIADRQNLLDPQLNGFYVSLGLSGKKLTLYKKNGATTTPVINGSILNINSSTNYFRVKVTRDVSGNWAMYSDTTAKGASTFVHYPDNEGTGSDNSNTYDANSWFGIVTTYTSGSSSQNFYFDNLYSGPVILDTAPPTASVTISEPDIFVTFNEPIDTNTAKNKFNYCILELPGQSGIACTPDSVASVTGNVYKFKLIYNGNPLAKDVLYTLTIKDVQDLEGNTMLPDTFMFAFHDPKTFDIVINEIMADPDPVVGLPNAEYIELYNRTNFPIDLNGWKLEYGSTSLSSKTFPAVTIPPKGYIILSNGTLMDIYGTNVSLFTSTSTLTNDPSYPGFQLILANQQGKLIHSVTYLLSWYQNSAKSNGGWSLEQIDPDNPCAGAYNWKASEATAGGTPGKINRLTELYAPNPDNLKPEIEHIGVYKYTPDRFSVYFTEPLDSLSFSNPLKFSIYLNNSFIGNPVILNTGYPQYNTAILQMPSTHPNIIQGNIYTFTIIDSVSDCSGNFISANSSRNFALPEDASANDIIINEVLSNPNDGGKDYVEIYNNSNKIIDLGTLTLATWDSITGTIEDPDDISWQNHLFFPGEYYCLTTDPDAVKKQYETTNPKGFITMASMPSYSNDNGIVVISNKSLVVIDKFTYTPDMHFPLLTSTKGVSLERISFSAPTEDHSNWHSASSKSGYGTPAYKNSQYAEFLQTDEPFTIYPEIFSPDNDGFNDILGISYKFENPGFKATIIIYDSKGRLVKKIAKDELLGTEGVFSWDGVTESNEKSPIGIYIIYSEIYDLQGKVKHYKNTAVLGSKIK